MLFLRKSKKYSHFENIAHLSRRINSINLFHSLKNSIVTQHEQKKKKSKRRIKKLEEDQRNEYCVSFEQFAKVDDCLDFFVLTISFAYHGVRVREHL